MGGRGKRGGKGNKGPAKGWSRGDDEEDWADWDGGEWVEARRGGPSPPGRHGTDSESWFTDQPVPRRRGPADPAAEVQYPQLPEEGYTCIGPHDQWWTGNKGTKYRMFGAASDGCLYCLRKWVEDYQEDIHAESDNFRYNCLDYAVDSRLVRNTATTAVEEYLMHAGLELTQPISQPGSTSKKARWARE